MNDENLQIFADEAEDLLMLAEQALLNLHDPEGTVNTQECINDLFRTFHTIKGAAGLFGLDPIVEFTHLVENLLVNVREGTLAVEEDMVALLLASRDHLEYLVEVTLIADRDIDEQGQQRGTELAEQLSAYLHGTQRQSAVQCQSSLATPLSGQAGARLEGTVANENWHISLRFGPNSFRNGMDPASFINYLSKLGELKQVLVIDDALPAWAEFDPESCYLGFEIELNAPHANKEQLEEVFEFVQDDCKISILPPHSHIDSYLKMIEALPEDEMRIGDMLVACGALTVKEKDNVLNAQDKLSDQVTAADPDNKRVPPLGVIAVDEKVVQQEVVDAVIKKQAVLKSRRENAQQTIRVNAQKLENLVNLVGELVIGSANTELNVRKLADPELTEAMENLLHLVEDVRDTTLGLRMVQIGETFDRYRRVVHEVSRDLGKNIELRTSGAETELDKTLIEKITDPLMHLVRNAIDHGIESPELRQARGKPAKGIVSLDAFHDSGSIVIRIHDDGGGLSKQKILAKAIANGIVQEGQKLSDQEIYRLIFEAGLSTAETVSNVSGRGVGMDVVRRNIEALRGHVEIESEEGVGSTISIRLPLTLAIIDGFQVRVGDAQYIVPLDMIDECIELTEELRGGDQSAHYINLRGEILPFMHLREMFGAAEDEDEKRQDNSYHENSCQENSRRENSYRENIVVVQFGGKKSGLVVDQLLGEHQTVIKPLGKVFQNLKGISGTTILGSGEVALIIDVPEMVQRIERVGSPRHI